MKNCKVTIDNKNNQNKKFSPRNFFSPLKRNNLGKIIFELLRLLAVKHSPKGNANKKYS